jgi:Acyclic terpene utilisation family protein AtuA
MPRSVRIGAGAGFADDRIDPAIELVERGDLDFLVFECLAERTIALRQLERRRDPTAGFDPLLRDRMTAVLAASRERGVRIVTNAGAANPRGAAAVVADVARDASLALRIGVVLGDDVLDLLDAPDAISANAYLGSDGIVHALDDGADVVVTGRVADAALFAGPLVHAHGWTLDDREHLASALAAGHLLECAGQVTGGYFADPGVNDVAGLADLGFPFADVGADGSVEISKVAGTGGVVDARTCTQQLLYEVHDPSRYLTPDAVVDFSGAVFTEVGPSRVALHGVRAAAAPPTLKVSVGYRAGFVGEGEISYAGPGCVARADLALEILEKRLRDAGLDAEQFRFERIGVDAIRRGPEPSPASDLPEVRIRVAGRVRSSADAERIGREVTGLWLNGPAGGGGARRTVTEEIEIRSTSVPRELVHPRVEWVEV